MDRCDVKKVYNIVRENRLDVHCSVAAFLHRWQQEKRPEKVKEK
jgi:hypothetical protein